MNEPTNTPPDEKLMLAPDGDNRRAVDLTWDAIQDLATQARMSPHTLVKRLIANLPHPHGRHIPPALMAMLSERDREAIRLADEARARKNAKRARRRG